MVRILSDFVLKSRFKKKLKSLTSVPKLNSKEIKSIVILVSGNYEAKEHLFIAFAKAFKVPTRNITIVVFNKNKIPLKIDFASLNENNFEDLFSEDIKNLSDNLFIRSNQNTLILSNVDQIPIKFQKQFLKN